MTFIETNILKPNDRTIRTEIFKQLTDYLLKYHPTGFDAACDIYVNNIEIKVDNWDMKLNEDDIIALVYRPAVTAAVAGGAVSALLINLAISTAVSYVIGKIFAPDMPNDLSANSANNSPASAYSLNSQQNEAKAGEVIPVVYGKVRMYPALISPPYRRYENNEQYLYQLMCIGQGKFNIDELLIADTNINNFRSGDIEYQTIIYDKFSTSGGLKAATSDSNYSQLVKTIPELDDLLVRGIPANTEFIMRFSGSDITFYDYVNGTRPDLTSLLNGSKITIKNTLNNDGVYTVNYVTDNVVTVQSHTFTTEPNVSFSDTTYSVHFGNWLEDSVASDLYSNTDIGSIFTAYGDTFQVTNKLDGVDAITSTTPDKPQETGGTINIVARTYVAEFETTYGTYIVDGSADNPIKTIEIDYMFPNGVYDTDANGVFIDRTLEFEIVISSIKYPFYLAPPLNYFYKFETVSITKKENNPLRYTFKWDVLSTIGDTECNTNLYITIKRKTSEPVDYSSQDTLYINSIKGKYVEPDNEAFGDVTLLWCKVKATNAITSLGQFSINGWFTRSDVDNTVKDVLTDIYTNNTYGGRLPLSDLDFDDTPTDTINGIFDTKLTLFDALKTAAKSNRYNVYPVGAKLALKYDGVQAVRTALYNETNILKDSFKLSYNFSEESETDSYKAIYRNADDFKENEAIYPTGGLYPVELELWGCTDTSKALAMATYLYKQDRARRKIVEFKTDVQGLIPQFMDKIGISHNLPEWGVSSEVRGVDGSTITLADNIDAALEYDSMIFRADDGSVSEILTFSGSGYDISVTNLPDWVHGFGINEPTKCSLGISNKIISDFIVTSVKPNGNQVLIQGVNYDETIYS